MNKRKCSLPDCVNPDNLKRNVKNIYCPCCDECFHDICLNNEQDEWDSSKFVCGKCLTIGPHNLSQHNISQCNVFQRQFEFSNKQKVVKWKNSQCRIKTLSSLASISLNLMKCIFSDSNNNAFYFPLPSFLKIVHDCNSLCFSLKRFKYVNHNINVLDEKIKVMPFTI
jgi:hypothetical protein